MSATDRPRPIATQDRTVPGWRWLEGPEAQAAEWKTLTDEFWRHVDLQVGEVALTQKFTDYDEERRQVILRIEAQIVAGNVSLPPLAL